MWWFASRTRFGFRREEVERKAFEVIPLAMIEDFVYDQTK
jgi:hypothetical protein